MKHREIMSLDATIDVVQFLSERPSPTHSIDVLSVLHHLRMYKGMLEILSREEDVNRESNAPEDHDEKKR